MSATFGAVTVKGHPMEEEKGLGKGNKSSEGRDRERKVRKTGGSSGKEKKVPCLQTCRKEKIEKRQKGVEKKGISKIFLKRICFPRTEERKHCRLSNAGPKGTTGQKTLANPGKMARVLFAKKGVNLPIEDRGAGSGENTE